MEYLLLLPAAALLYGVLVVAPSWVCYRSVFSRRRVRTFDQVDLSATYYAAFAQRLKNAVTFLRERPHETVNVTANDGVVLSGAFWDAGAPRTALLLPGYGGVPLCQFGLQAETLYRAGFNLLLVDQRAHGASGGSQSTLGMKEADDVLAWTEEVRRRVPGGTVLIYGISMGCTAAAFAADRLDPETVRGLILDCGFSSPEEQILWDLRKRHLPRRLMMPWVRLFIRRQIGKDPRQSVTDPLRRTAIPALFLHGEEDRTVPIAQGKQNYGACASPKACLWVPGAQHTTALTAGGKAAEETLFSFLRGLCRFEI